MTWKPWELCFSFTCQSRPLLALPCWNVLCSASAEQLQNLAVTIPSGLGPAGGSTPLLRLLLYQLRRQKRSWGPQLPSVEDSSRQALRARVLGALPAQPQHLLGCWEDKGYRTARRLEVDVSPQGCAGMLSPKAAVLPNSEQTRLQLCCLFPSAQAFLHDALWICLHLPAAMGPLLNSLLSGNLVLLTRFPSLSVAALRVYFKYKNINQWNEPWPRAWP